ncbi:MAG: site-2 protease family protein [Candidatus Zixiibacteriota bacterium]
MTFLVRSRTAGVILTVMPEFDLDTLVDSVTPLLSDLFEVDAVYRHDDQIVFSITPRYNRKRSINLLKDRLKLAGYTFTLDYSQVPYVLGVDPKRRLRIPTLNIVLFVATLFSVYVVPVFLRNLFAQLELIAAADSTGAAGKIGLVRFLELLFVPVLKGTAGDLAAGHGLVFTVALMSILIIHESGHFIAGRRRRIITSWPYFIPAPNIIGSFGAVIVQKTPFWNRRDLLEVGAAGPIAGWVVALVWLLWGLSQSTLVPVEEVPLKDVIPPLGWSIALLASTKIIFGSIPQDTVCVLSEAGFAGWVGLLVTAINLLPIGQLDGGHILYGLGRRLQHLLARLAVVGLVILGFQSFMWWIFAALGLVFGLRHPPTLDDRRPPGRAATTLGIVSLVILVLSFTPAPFG